MFSANTPVFGQDILVKMQRDDNMIALRAYSRKGGARGRLLIFADALQAWLDGDRERPFYDADCGNFLILRLYGGFCKMQLFWLSEYGSGDLHGIRQDVEIPENQFLTLMQNGTPICRLCKPETGNVRFDASPSARVIRGILSNKREEDNGATLYGSTYSDLLDSVENMLIDLLERHAEGTGVVKYTFSGKI